MRTPSLCLALLLLTGCASPMHTLSKLDHSDPGYDTLQCHNARQDAEAFSAGRTGRAGVAAAGRILLSGLVSFVPLIAMRTIGVAEAERVENALESHCVTRPGASTWQAKRP